MNIELLVVCRACLCRKIQEFKSINKIFAFQEMQDQNLPLTMI